MEKIIFYLDLAITIISYLISIFGVLYGVALFLAGGAGIVWGLMSFLIALNLFWLIRLTLATRSTSFRKEL